MFLHDLLKVSGKSHKRLFESVDIVENIEILSDEMWEGRFVPLDVHNLFKSTADALKAPLLIFLGF